MPDITQPQPVLRGLEDTEAPLGGGPTPDLMISDIAPLQPVLEGLEDRETPPGDGFGLDPVTPDTVCADNMQKPAKDGSSTDRERLRWRWDDKESCDKRLAEVKVGCNEYELKLMNGVFDINISPDYSDIYVNRNIIDELERVTSLSLHRPDAFQYGILRKNKVTGALLYGPPGTGKALLAKELARNSGFLMLEITSADCFQSRWGEDEKVIRAVFTLARKLSPCIHFIDEADGICNVRKSGDGKHVRAALNQLLLEWDGVASSVDSPFLLLSANRSFDLDPAVLRCAPLHIHIDIPTASQRQKILQLLLKGELLAPDINFPMLTQLTPAYTGSDLKNLCVSAVLNCVHSESPDHKTGKFPSRRVLQRHHFQQAFKTVRATILTAKQAAQLDAFRRRAGG